MQQACRRHAEDMQMAFSLGTRSFRVTGKFWHSGFLRIPKASLLNLTGNLAYRTVQWNDGWANRVQQFTTSIYMSWFDPSNYVLWLQYPIPSVLANFGELGPNFEKISSRSSYESDGGVNQEFEKMLYFRYFWARLGISYSCYSLAIDHFKRSLVLKYTIIQVPNSD